MKNNVFSKAAIFITDGGELKTPDAIGTATNAKRNQANSDGNGNELVRRRRLFWKKKFSKNKQTKRIFDIITVNRITLVKSHK